MRHLGPLTAPLLLTSLLFAAPATGQLPVLRTVDSPTDSHGFGEAAAVIGDFDGDGTLDYAVSEVNGLPLPKVDAVHVISGATGAILATFVEEAAGDDFGEALAGVGDLDGDGSPDLLIGASEHDTGGLHSAGRATVVSGATGAVLLAFGGTDTNHDLGQSVAAIGDVDGDGKTDFAIASPGEDLLGHKSGVARLHRGSDGAVLQTYGNGLTTADLADSYADQVAAAGDLDGDGVPDVLVSAHGRLNSPHGRPGAIEARSGADGSLLFELRDDLTPHHAQQFGRSLTGGTDVTGDGVPEILVGATGYQVAGTQLGAVFLFDGATQAQLAVHAGDPSAPGFLGHHVAFVGDLNGDGFEDYAGASDYAGAAGASGYVKVWSGADHHELGQLASDAEGFGSCLVPLGDVTGDRMPDLLVGAPNERVVQTLCLAGALRYGVAPLDPAQTLDFRWVPTTGVDPARGCFEISGAAPGALGAFALSGAAADLPAFGNSILIDLGHPGFYFVPVFFDATGTYTSIETTLRQPALDGLSIFCQGLVFTGGFDFTTSNGLELLLTD